MILELGRLRHHRDERLGPRAAEIEAIGHGDELAAVAAPLLEQFEGICAPLRQAAMRALTFPLLTPIHVEPGCDEAEASASALVAQKTIACGPAGACHGSTDTGAM